MPEAIRSFIEFEFRSTDKRQFWAAASQKYAPAGVLLDYLEAGWVLSRVVGVEEFYYAGLRHVSIYHFELFKNGQFYVIPVQGNPVVRRLLRDQNLREVPLRPQLTRSSDHA